MLTVKNLITMCFIFTTILICTVSSSIKTDIKNLHDVEGLKREIELERVFKVELEECRNSKVEILVYPYWCTPRDDGKFTLDLIKGGLK